MPTPTTRTLGRMLAGGALAMSLGCGQGLYTRGTVVDVDAGPPLQDLGSAPSDAIIWADVPNTSDDVAALCPPTTEGVTQSKTKQIGIEGGTIPLCEATLVVKSFIFAEDVKSDVTLSRVSSQGVPPGLNSIAVGPVFVIKTERQFPQPVQLTMDFKPFYELKNNSVPKLAYYQLRSHQWIAFSQSEFDAGQSRLKGQVDNMDWTTLDVAPFASCTNDSDCVAPLMPNCRSGLCQ